MIMSLSATCATGTAASPDPALFERRIRPLLVEQCVSCHGSEKQKGGLRLDTPAGIRRGGDRGSLLGDGNPSDSLLVRAVGYADEELRMPPKTRLSAAQVGLISNWIVSGAAMPDPEATPSPAVRSSGLAIAPEAQRHWSFQPLTRPEVPTVRDATWVRNPIDAFVLARLEARGLRPNPPARPEEWLRRVSYNLTGLPPSPEVIQRHAADLSPEGWDRLAAELLDSPQYGEHWARHWLDLVRYGESNSYETDEAKPHVWRYRDYVIRSFNEDKPYDRFVREQLAGDEMPEGGRDGSIATGFYRLGIWDADPADRELAVYDALDDVLTTTGQVFLGLTVDCARCHDHKIDPISQADYYRLLAFFRNINPYRNGGPTDEAPLPGSGGNEVRGTNTVPERALVVTEAGREPPETHVLLRGNPAARGERVEPGFPTVLRAPMPSVTAPPPGVKSCGRRLALADWVVSAGNPLAARVVVNRVWQHHFGRGLVRTPNDFGLQGERPTHPELLDWLASELIASGWRLKTIQRLILQSNTGRLSSRGRADGLAADVENQLFWRFNMRRLSAEEIRDSILAVTGELNLRLYGPSVFVEIPKAVLATQSVPGKGWGTSRPEDQSRRSVYIHAKRSLRVPLLDSFDLAESDRTAPVRFTSVQPTQALGMLNSEFLGARARRLAERLRAERPGNPEAQVRLGFSRVTSRPARDAEVAAGLALVERLQVREHLSQEQALESLGLLLLNLNEFLYLD